jgi:cytochrome c oxidase subunit 2
MPNARIRLPRPALHAPRAAALLGPVGLALLLGGCMPKPVTPQGKEIEQLYNIVFIIAAAIFIFVEGLIVFAVLRYRRRPHETGLPVQTHGNNLLEVIWTLIPTGIVLVMFVLSWQTLNNIDKVSNTADVRVRAVAQRFQWSFEYLSPDGQQVLFTQLAPEMVVPVGTQIHLGLRSPDVIHAFYVPRFLFKRDVVPGVENAFEFSIEESDAGQSFSGQCAELCGEFHGAMRFTVRAVTLAESDTWLQEQINRPPPGPPASGGPPPSGPTVTLSALNIAFDPKTLTAPAGVAWTLEFKNNDPSVPHNVEIKDPAGAVSFQGEIFPGVDTRRYPIPALSAGAYTFVCTVHPNMTGTLTVQ